MNGMYRCLPLLVVFTGIGFLAFLLIPTFHTRAVSAAENQAVDFYVSPEGRDNWSGTLAAPNAGKTDGPFASLERARKAVRDMKKGARNAPIVVAMRGCTYVL